MSRLKFTYIQAILLRDPNADEEARGDAQAHLIGGCGLLTLSGLDRYTIDCQVQGQPGTTDAGVKAELVTGSDLKAVSIFEAD
ncbi:hypothetical protein Acsp02_71120 [Actinoplanes sp. NBRC 103695]|nr:hypothetical protein Acsp02_71120 [Actinoplanes sp. NBRC 103695]